jgi:hypothetical protein
MFILIRPVSFPWFYHAVVLASRTKECCSYTHFQRFEGCFVTLGCRLCLQDWTAPCGLPCNPVLGLHSEHPGFPRYRLSSVLSFSFCCILTLVEGHLPPLCLLLLKLHQRAPWSMGQPSKLQGAQLLLGLYLCSRRYLSWFWVYVGA